MTRVHIKSEGIFSLGSSLLLTVVSRHRMACLTEIFLFSEFSASLLSGLFSFDPKKVLAQRRVVRAVRVCA